MRTEARRGGLHRNVNESPRVPASAWGLRGTNPAELEPTGHSAAAAWSSAPRPDGSPRGAAHSRPVPAQPQREQRLSLRPEAPPFVSAPRAQRRGLTETPAGAEFVFTPRSAPPSPRAMRGIASGSQTRAKPTRAPERPTAAVGLTRSLRR